MSRNQVRCLLVLSLGCWQAALAAAPAKVILDADTANEIDDVPAIVLALKSGKMDVLAVTAAQWNRVETCGRETMHESWVLNNRVLSYLGMKHVRSLKGSRTAVGQGQHTGAKSGTVPNEASAYIIKKALEMPPGEKLIVITTGSATNVASAIIDEPAIISRIAVYFIGTTYDFHRGAFNKNEFNVRSDLNAVDALFNTVGLELHVMPANVCTKLLVTKGDLDRRLRSDNGVEGLLKERWKQVNPDNVDWTMWDFAIVQAVMNPQWTRQTTVKSPSENVARDVFLYTEIDAAAIMENFWEVFLK